MNEPLVSVIIPSFDRFDYLMNAIESINNQTYKNIEKIIVNDGSSDDRYYNFKFDNKTKVVNLEINQKKLHGYGPGSIRNFGTDISDGHFLAFLDDDDIWLPDKLKIQVEAMLSAKYLLSSTEGLFGYGVYDPQKKYKLYNKEQYMDDLKFLYSKTNFIKKNKLPEIWTYEFTRVHNCFITSSVVVEKKLFEKLGGFRNLPLWADYDCWLGLQNFTDSLYIDKPLIYYDGSHAGGRKYEK